MDSPDNNYIVYVRVDNSHSSSPHKVEQPLVTCSSYAEARQIQREYRRAHQEVVIRFEGISGGGD